MIRVLRFTGWCVLLLTATVVAVCALAARGETSPLMLHEFTAADCSNLCWLGIEITRSDTKDALDALDASNIPHSDYTNGDGFIRATVDTSEVVMFVSFRYQSIVRVTFHRQHCPLELLAALGLPDRIDTAGSGQYLIYREGLMIGVVPSPTDEHFVVEVISREQASAIMAVRSGPDNPTPTWDTVRRIAADACT
ncbi:MAG: hypothetical protein AAFR56_07265 [Chloroflexota bacterium]